MPNIDIIKIWEQLHWIRPQFLWLILPVLVFPIFFFIKKEKSDTWVNKIAPHLRKYTIIKGNLRALYLARFLLIFTWLVTVIAISGPSFEQIEKPGAQVESTTLIMVQVSESMLNKDLQPNRLERAKYKIKDLIDANPEVKVGLIAYAGTAHLLIPPTTDYQTLRIHLEALQPSVMPIEGINLGEALVLADTMVKDNTAPSHFIIMSDEVENSAVMQEFMANRKDKMTFIPFVPFNDAVKTTLKEFDKISNIDVLLPTLDKSDIEQLARELRDGKIFQEDPELQESMWIEHGYYLLWIIGFVVLIWFRKGFMPTLIIALTLSSCSGNISSDDLFLTRDYQGQKAMNEGDYQKAAKLFEDPLHKGTALFKAGNLNKAIQEFSKDSSAQGYYNIGVAYLKQGNYNSAYNAFYKANMMDSTFTQSEKAIGEIEGWFKSQDNEFETLSDTIADALFEKMSENKNSEEDLGGGGQEATEEQMQEERLMEEVESDTHKAEEEDEIPEEFEKPDEMDARKVIIRDVQEDPSEFMRKKFEYQLKKRNE